MISLKKIIPENIYYILKKNMRARKFYSIEKMELKEKFNYIYKKKIWSLEGEGNKQDFYSGTGSHDTAIVEPYVKAITTFLEGFKDKKNVVDLGCGDFNVGKQISSYSKKYVACDIVDELIFRNRLLFSSDNIDFQIINIVDNDLPDGDIVLIRQVLQHLSNSDISKIVPKLYKYKFLIVTEHLPNSENFISNKDFVSGPSIRLERNSGIVLTDPPFNLCFKEHRIICDVEESGGRIVTTLYKLV